jgi:Sec-independent protein translocase protein TatA
MATNKKPPRPPLEGQIGNIAALGRSLVTAIGEFTDGLAQMQQEALSLERDLEARKAEAQRELEALDAKIAEKLQLHTNIEASLKTLNDRKAAILKSLEEVVTRAA